MNPFKFILRWWRGTQPEPSARELIVGLRGGVPESCDFCGLKTPPQQLHPEEAGRWICEYCMRTWDEISH